MREIFEPLKYLAVEQLERIDPWTAGRVPVHATDDSDIGSDRRCIFQQVYSSPNQDYLKCWETDSGTTDAPGGIFWTMVNAWDENAIPRQELADAITECKERLRMPETTRLPLFEEVALVPRG
jgi:hypothetical protein